MNLYRATAVIDDNSSAFKEKGPKQQGLFIYSHSLKK